MIIFTGRITQSGDVLTHLMLFDASAGVEV